MKKLFLFFVLFFGLQNPSFAQELNINVSPDQTLNTVDAKAKNFFIPIYNSVESFRKEKAEFFVSSRDRAKYNLGMALSENALEKIKPFFAPPTAPSALPNEDSSESLKVNKIDNPKDYGLFIFYSAMASMFSNIWLFYAVCVLLIFFTIKTIFKMTV